MSTRTSPTDRTAAKSSLIVKHPGCPQWGLGYLIEERDDKRFYEFEDGLSHTIAKPFWAKMEPIQLGAAETAALEERIRGRRPKTSTSKKPRARAAVVATTTFPEQLARFEEEFPGGFEGEVFTKQERGAPNDKVEKKSKAYKQQAIGTAQRLLAKDELAALIADKKFGEVASRMRDVHTSASGLLHPIGDAIPFSKMPEEHHEAYALALFDLLHGEGDFAPRFDALVAALATDNLATWPLATAPAALFDPEHHAFVKPSFYQKQASVLKMDVGYERVPASAVYERMQKLAVAAQAKLVEAGQSPRDLMDVYSFLWRMNSPKKPAKK